MKRSLQHGFTLIEMLTVMAVIIVLAGMVVAVSGLVQQKAARSRAQGEVVALAGACEAYKADFGTYPRHSKDSTPFKGEAEVTDDLKPAGKNPDIDPTAGKYKRASLFLYVQLSGDTEPADTPDGKPEKGAKTYFEFSTRRDMLQFDKDARNEPTEIKYIRDPFGNSYGYSTAAAEAEEDYRKAIRKDASAEREDNPAGFNPTFDLWSTGGTTKKGKEGADYAKWITNWK